MSLPPKPKPPKPVVAELADHPRTNNTGCVIALCAGVAALFMVCIVFGFGVVSFFSNWSEREMDVQVGEVRTAEPIVQPAAPRTVIVQPPAPSPTPPPTIVYQPGPTIVHQPGPTTIPPAASKSAASQTATPTSADNEWLTADLPPLLDPEKAPPFHLTKVTVRRNHCDQHLVELAFRRDAVIPFVAGELKLVVLPAAGGRLATYLSRHIVISPFPPRTMTAVVDPVLDYRGVIPGGARAYLEMRLASPTGPTPAQRISSVYWLGSEADLAAARRNGVAKVAAREHVAPPRESLPDDVKLPTGLPLYYRAGDRWQSATYTGTTNGNQLKLLIFFAKPGKLYLPWFVLAERRDLQIETAALAALRSTPAEFRTFDDQYRQRLARLDAPSRLQPAAADAVVAGQRLVSLSGGWMTPYEALGTATAEQTVPLRDLRTKRQLHKQVAHLYIDPTPAVSETAVPVTTSPAATESPTTTDSPDETTSSPTAPPVRPGTPIPSPSSTSGQFVALTADAKVKVGDRFKAPWGNRWWDVEILDVLDDGRVKIRWVGWGENWDHVRARTTLVQPLPSPTTASTPSTTKPPTARIDATTPTSP